MTEDTQTPETEAQPDLTPEGEAVAQVEPAAQPEQEKAPDAMAQLMETNKKLVQSLEGMAQQMAEVRDFVGLVESEDSETTPTTTEPTEKETQLTAQVQSYREAMQAHIDATLVSLTEKQQELVKKLGGDEPLAQFRALSSLMEAGLLASETKPKTARGSHQGRADANGVATTPATRQQRREALRKDLRDAGLA